MDSRDQLSNRGFVLLSTIIQGLHYLVLKSLKDRTVLSLSFKGITLSPKTPFYVAFLGRKLE